MMILPKTVSTSFKSRFVSTKTYPYIILISSGSIIVFLLALLTSYLISHWFGYNKIQKEVPKMRARSLREFLKHSKFGIVAKTIIVNNKMIMMMAAIFENFAKERP